MVGVCHPGDIPGQGAASLMWYITSGIITPIRSSRPGRTQSYKPEDEARRLVYYLESKIQVVFFNL